MKTKTSATNTNMDVSVLERYIQVIPHELLHALKDSATKNGILLDMEIATRLIAFMSEPELTFDNALSRQVLNRKFTDKEAVEECKRKRKSNIYVYEMEKLRLFLRFEENLPRNIKENFAVIDVKEITKQIREELDADEKRHNKKQGE